MWVTRMRAQHQDAARLVVDRMAFNASSPPPPPRIPSAPPLLNPPTPAPRSPLPPSPAHPDAVGSAAAGAARAAARASPLPRPRRPAQLPRAAEPKAEHLPAARQRKRVRAAGRCRLDVVPCQRHTHPRDELAGAGAGAGAASGKVRGGGGSGEGALAADGGGGGGGSTSGGGRGCTGPAAAVRRVTKAHQQALHRARGEPWRPIPAKP